MKLYIFKVYNIMTLYTYTLWNVTQMSLFAVKVITEAIGETWIGFKD